MSPIEEPRTYRMDFLANGAPRNCPIEGCPGQAATRTAMRVHFFHWRVQDAVIILDDGNLPHPQCPRFDMLVPCKALNGRHTNTAQFSKGAEWKRRRLAAEDMRESMVRAF